MQRLRRGVGDGKPGCAAIIASILAIKVEEAAQIMWLFIAGFFVGTIAGFLALAVMVGGRGENR